MKLIFHKDILKLTDLYLSDQVIHKMKLYAFITAFFYIKTTFAGIEIPREKCEWLTGISYGVDIKCDGN